MPPGYNAHIAREHFQTFVKRLKREGVSLRAWCVASGVSNGTISNFVRGETDSLTEKTYVKLANGASNLLKVEVTPEALKGADIPDEGGIAVAGYVGAGGEIPAYVDDYAKGEGLEHVPRPPGMRGDVVAVKVRGPSMLPVYRDGDVLFYSLDDRRHPAELIGIECIVRLRDGRTMLKEVRHGSRKGSFTLGSHNWGDIPDVRIEWAVPVRWVQRARTSLRSNNDKEPARPVKS